MVIRVLLRQALWLDWEVKAVEEMEQIIFLHPLLVRQTLEAVEAAEQHLLAAPHPQAAPGWLSSAGAIDLTGGIHHEQTCNYRPR